MKPLFLTIGLLGVLLLFVQATPPHPDRNLRIPARPGWYQLDTLSIIAESFSITGPDRKPLDEAFYELDPFRARLRLRTPEFWHHDSLGVSYSVWPVFFPEPVFLRDTSLIQALAKRLHGLLCGNTPPNPGFFSLRDCKAVAASPAD